MSTASKRDRKAAISNAVSNFIARYRIPMIVLLVAVVVIAVGLFVYFEIRDNRAAAAAEELASVEEVFTEWRDAEENGKDELEGVLLEDIEELVSTYGGTYAGARGRFLRGEIHWHKEEWTEAAEWYTAVADNNPDSHLATIALYNAAAAHESAGEVPAAVESLTRLVEEYGDEDAAEIPRALFSLGRLQEGQESYEEAAARYRELIENHGASNWTNLAHDRIIFLTSAGLIEEAS
ncbi:MAG: tetratricopeptide repeat protein [Spirochaetaceae bacterium]